MAILLIVILIFAVAFMSKFILIHPDDSVVIALVPMAAGDQLRVKERTITLLQDVDKGGKVAITAMAQGEPVVKYGCPIGRLTAAVQAGEWVHTHNVKRHSPMSLSINIYRTFRR